jgi:hypothetical protein
MARTEAVTIAAVTTAVTTTAIEGAAEMVALLSGAPSSASGSAP